MFCPSCGANNSTEQKFCRTCGMNLSLAAESLLEQFPTAERAGLLRRERRLERFGQIAFGGLGFALLCGIAGIIYVILTKMVLSGAQPLAGIALIIFVVFAALSLVYVAIAADLKERKEKIARAVADPVLPAPNTGKLLEEPRFEPIHSVVEDSTELLTPKSKTRRL